MAPRRHPDALWEELDGEVVAWSPDQSALHVLDARAATVYLLLDGVHPISQLAAEVAAAVGAPVEDVLRDVTALVGQLVDLRLVQNSP